MSTVYTTDLAPESAAQGKWAAFVARSAAHRASDRVGQNSGGLAVRHRRDPDFPIRMDVEHGSHQQATGQLAEPVLVAIATIGRAHVCTTVTYALLVCALQIVQTTSQSITS